MIQGVLKKPDGTNILSLVLEPGNFTRLREGKPIQLHVEDMFPDGIPKRLDVAISYTATPVSDSREILADALMGFDERTPVAKKVRPHCGECGSTVEQYGMMRNDNVPFATLFCPMCGCVMGVIALDAVKDVKGTK